MKAILEFELPEEKSDFDLAVQGADWYYVAFKMNQWLRGQIKHAPEFMSDDSCKAFEQCRKKLWSLTAEENLDLG